MRTLGPAVAFLAMLSLVHADEIRKWVDEQGRVHYSNRGDTTREAPRPESGDGWESVLERQEGADEFSQRADAAINSLNADRMRKRRERDRASAVLQKTQEDIARIQQTRDPTRLPDLRAQEAKQVSEVRRLEAELAEIDGHVARMKAVKAMGKDQADKLGQNPFFQFGQ